MTTDAEKLQMALVLLREMTSLAWNYTDEYGPTPHFEGIGEMGLIEAANQFIEAEAV